MNLSVYIDTKKLLLMMIVTALLTLSVLFTMAYASQHNVQHNSIMAVLPIVLVFVLLAIIIRMIAIALGEWIAQHPPVFTVNEEGITITAAFYPWAEIDHVEKKVGARFIVVLKNGKILRLKTHLWTMSASVLVYEIKRRM